MGTITLIHQDVCLAPILPPTTNMESLPLGKEKVRRAQQRRLLIREEKHSQAARPPAQAQPSPRRKITSERQRFAWPPGSPNLKISDTRGVGDWSAASVQGDRSKGVCPGGRGSPYDTGARHTHTPHPHPRTGGRIPPSCACCFPGFLTTHTLGTRPAPSCPAQPSNLIHPTQHAHNPTTPP